MKPSHYALLLVGLILVTAIPSFLLGRWNGRTSNRAEIQALEVRIIHLEERILFLQLRHQQGLQ